MKPTTSIFLTILILFQSCYSYKKVDIQNIKIDASKKYTIETKNGDKFKGKLVKITNENLIIKKRKHLFFISKTTIIKIKKKKFSYWKTSLLLIMTIGLLSADFPIVQIGDLNQPLY